MGQDVVSRLTVAPSAPAAGFGTLYPLGASDAALNWYYKRPDATVLQLANLNEAQTWTGVQSFTSPAITTSITTPSTTFTAFAGATTLLTIGGTGASSVFAIPGTLDASGTTGALTNAGGFYNAKAAIIGGALTVSGIAGFNGVTTIQTTTANQLQVGYDASNHLRFSVASNGATTITSTGAGSSITMASPLSSTNNFNVNTTKFAVNATTGASSFANTLAIGGTALNNSAFAVNGTGQTFFATFSDFSSTTLTIAGSGGTITLVPTTTLAITGNQTVSGTLDVTGVYKAGGTSGVASFGPSIVTSITVKNGIITAIS